MNTKVLPFSFTFMCTEPATVNGSEQLFHQLANIKSAMVATLTLPFIEAGSVALNNT